MIGNQNEIPYNKIDPLCVPFVKYFNSIGLKTAFSCQGHNNANMHKFYIEFSKEVADEDIRSFMNKFPAPFYGKIGTKQILGHFTKVAYGLANNGKFLERWRYVSDLSGNYKSNQKAAESDLEIFKQFVPEKTESKVASANHFCQAEIILNLLGKEKEDVDILDIFFPKIDAEMDSLEKELANTSNETKRTNLVGELLRLDSFCDMFSEEICGDIMYEIAGKMLEKNSTPQAYKIAVNFDNYREDRDYWTGEFDFDYDWDYEVLESGVDIGKYVTETQDIAIDWNKLHNTPGLSTGYFDANGIEICVGDTVKEGCNGLVSKVVWNAERASFWLEGLGEGYGIENSDTEWEVVSDKEACIETYCKKDDNFDFEM